MTNMKRIIYIFLAVFLFTGCEDFLNKTDPTPLLLLNSSMMKTICGGWHIVVSTMRLRTTVIGNYCFICRTPDLTMLIPE